MVIWGNFQDLTVMTRGGGQKIGNWGDVIYGGPLCFKTGLNEDQLYHAKKQSYGV